MSNLWINFAILGITVTSVTKDSLRGERSTDPKVHNLSGSKINGKSLSFKKQSDKLSRKRYGDAARSRRSFKADPIPSMGIGMTAIP
jgi:hypothetical protein